jgi:TetR/AcrR family transcriptional regulator, transcriptional repressor for nem operon
MAYSRGHRAQVRDRIIASARRLFNRSGFESVSIDSIMEDAGLTRGGFYAYFKSKSDLYVEVLGCFFTDPNWKNKWKGIEIDPASPEPAAQIVRAYLSRQHFDDVDNSCPMVALPNDVARSDEKVRETFNGVFKAMVAMLGRDVKSSNRDPEDAALAIAALCVGGMVLARALSDTTLADRLRDAAAEASLALGGWKSENSQSSSGRRVKSRTA